MVPVKRKLAPHDVLFKEGDATKSFFLVISGVVSLFNERNGKNVEKARLASNAIVGDLIFMQPQPREVSVRAVTDCDIVEFPFDQIVLDLKTLPGWAQLMLKSLPDQLRGAHKELRDLKGESESDKLTPDEIIRGIATLRLALSSVEPEDSHWQWDKIREYSIQAFQFPALKLEPLVRSFAEAEWLKMELEQTDIIRLSTPDNARLLEFENFVRHYRHSRGKTSMIEVASIEFTILTSLLMAAEGQVDNKGVARVSLPSALTVAHNLPGGAAARIDQYDLLPAKGLDISKETTDQGLRMAFNYSELEKIKNYWKILLAI